MKVVLFAMPHDEATAVNVDVHRRPRSLRRWVIDRRGDPTVARLDACLGRVSGDLRKPDSGFGGGVDDGGEQPRRQIGHRLSGQYRHSVAL